MAEESTYLVAPKEAPAHVPNEATLFFLAVALAVVVPVCQVIVPTRHLER